LVTYSPLPLPHLASSIPLLFPSSVYAVFTLPWMLLSSRGQGRAGQGDAEE
jgi:hypothetical protein